MFVVLGLKGSKKSLQDHLERLNLIYCLLGRNSARRASIIALIEFNAGTVFTISKTGIGANNIMILQFL